MLSLQLLIRAGRLFASAQRHRPVHCSRCLGKSVADKSLEEMETETEGSLNIAYSEDEIDTILHVLNTAHESQLGAVKLLRGKKSASIVQHREKYGPFLDLDSVAKVPYFKHKTMIKVFDSILSPADRDEREEKKAQSRSSVRFIKPDLPTERLEATESIVSIVFGIRKFAWSHVDRSMTVLAWRQEEWYRFLKGAYFPHVYLEDVSTVVSKLPMADLYILEKPGISMQNSSLFPVMLHLRTVEAMLYALLNKQHASDGEHRVLSITRNIVGKHFDLMVGESRTSGIEITKQLLLQSATEEQLRVRFPPDLIFRYRNHFQTRGQNRNEELSDALLQAIAFFELAVL